MNRIRTNAGIALFALGLPLGVAGTAAAAGASVAQGSGVGLTLTARIVKVSAPGGFTMKLALTTYTVKVTSSTKITFAGKAEKLANLKTGELAKVTGHITGNTISASAVSATTGPAL